MQYIINGSRVKIEIHEGNKTHISHIIQNISRQLNDKPNLTLGVAHHNEYFATWEVEPMLDDYLLGGLVMALIGAGLGLIYCLRTGGF